MDIGYREVSNVGGVPVRVPMSDDYRRCSVCGMDRESNIGFGSYEHGARIAFVCPEHGIQSLIDPFRDLR